jgi:hypothetical protein
MKRGSSTSLSDRMTEMSIRGLILTILVLVALIALLVLIATVIGQNTGLGEGGIRWITRWGVVLL